MDRNTFYSEIEKWISIHLKSSKERPLFVGINGPQGAGKSTLSAELVKRFQENGFQSLCLSIDDFYLTHEDQKALARRSKNPFLQQRGYPGTHDLELGKTILDRLRAGEPCSLPRYDKSKHSGEGDRAAQAQWPKITERQDIVILEGWMLGFAAVDNVLEPSLAEINTLLGCYEDWLTPLDLFLYLKPEDSQFVVDWRIEAEQKMRDSGKDSMTDEQVKNYVEKFLPAYQLYREGIKERAPQFLAYREILIGKNRLPKKLD